MKIKVHRYICSGMCNFNEEELGNETWEHENHDDGSCNILARVAADAEQRVNDEQQKGAC